MFKIYISTKHDIKCVIRCLVIYVWVKSTCEETVSNNGSAALFKIYISTNDNGKLATQYVAVYVYTEFRSEATL